MIILFPLLCSSPDLSRLFPVLNAHSTHRNREEDSKPRWGCARGRQRRSANGARVLKSEPIHELRDRVKAAEVIALVVNVESESNPVHQHTSAGNLKNRRRGVNISTFISCPDTKLIRLNLSF
jgi:hypothetical protein